MVADNKWLMEQLADRRLEKAHPVKVTDLFSGGTLSATRERVGAGGA